MPERDPTISTQSHNRLNDWTWWLLARKIAPMFAFLRGVVARKTATYLELDVNGVGYEVFAPDTVMRKLVVDTPATLLTFCYIREDAFHIYGFLREEERVLFKTLLSISGVGPRVALGIMSAMSVLQVTTAINNNDVTAFTKVSGVGKKGAQRIVLEMRTKLGQDTELGALLGEPEGQGADEESDDVVAALCSLGCTMNEAKRAAAKARDTVGADAPDEEVVKAALRSMSKV